MNKNGKMIKKWLIAILCCAVAAFVIPLVTTVFLAEDDGPVVIILDPGHGGSDVGAVNHINGLNEADANLAIALACRDELLKYDGVEVYMTHTGLDKSARLSLGDRVAMVETHNADILISLHCNDSSSPTANGSEVYVSHSTYSQRYNSDSTALAIEFLEEFRELGLRIRGVKTRLSNGSRIYHHADGTIELGDYYAVIGSTIKRYGVPGILVEHGFVTGDYGYLNSPEKLAALGTADAQAIVSYFGLTLRGEDSPVSIDQPEAIIVSEMDVASASDVNTALLTVPETPTVEYYEMMQDIRLDYEELTKAGKTLIDSERLNHLYAFLPELDRQLHPVRIEALEESELSIDRIRHTISGVNLAAGGLAGTNVSQLMEDLYIFIDETYATEQQAKLGDVVISITDSTVSSELDIGAQLGTGCQVCLLRNGELIDSLSIVITCDLSGDGMVDSRDQLLLENHIDGTIQLSEAALRAADINMDGEVDRIDLDLMLRKVVNAN